MAISTSDPGPTAPPAAASGEQLSLELRLLLTCARLELSADQRERLRQLAGDVTDWPALIAQGDRHLILPLVYRHLRAVAPETLPADVLAALHRRCQRRILGLMAMAADQQRLVQQVLKPQQVPYALIKGPSLAQRYYGDLGLRQCRDVDVLIAPDRLLEVCQALLPLGYQLDPGPLAERYRQGLMPKDLAAACRYLNVVTLISPRGTRFELHRLIDSKGYIFTTDALLGQTEAIAIQGNRCRVLPTAALFTYICYHHSRHQWGRLHWLSDLDAMQRHPSFNLQAIQTFAEPLGLWPTVQASLALYGACQQPHPQVAPLPHPQARSMRDACLQMIAASPTEELALMQQRSTPDFNFSWQIRFLYTCRLALSHIHPTYADYMAWPLPLGLHFLYYGTRPVRLIWRRLSGRLGQRGGGPLRSPE